MVIHHYLGSGTMTHIDLRVCGEQRKEGRERSKVDTVFIHKKEGGEAALRRSEGSSRYLPPPNGFCLLKLSQDS